MQVAIHFGTHGTEPERMMRTLMENRDWMLANGIEVVPPGRYKGVLDEALSALKGGDAPPEMEDVIYDALLEGDHVRRMVLSQASLIGAVPRCIGPRGLFPQAAARMRAVAGLFPSAEVEVSLAIRNPALQVPHLIERSEQPYDKAMNGIDPAALRWGPAMLSIVEAMQGRRVVVWCYEDTPLIWPEAVRRISQIPAEVPLKSGLAVIGELLSPEGMSALRDGLNAPGGNTIDARRDLFTKVLADHAKDEAVMETVTLPGWTQDLVDRMSRDYAEDVAMIAALPGVEFLAP